MASSKKRFHREVGLEVKYKALLELEKGKTNKEVAQLFDVPSNTLSTWKKHKSKIVEAFQKGSTSTKRVKVDTYDQVNKAVLQWFFRMRSEKVPVNGVLIKEKALYFAQELKAEKFQKDGYTNGKAGSFEIFCFIKNITKI